MTASSTLRQDPPHAKEALSIEAFGTLLFLIAETMFFAGLVSAYIALRTGAAQWHPAGLPPLARPLSISNTVLLSLSGVSVLLAQLSLRRGDVQGLKQFLGVTLAIGLVFVGVQAFELTSLTELVPARGNIFGSVFYWYVGFHAGHVLAGVAWLAFVFRRARRGLYGGQRTAGVTVFALYWYFVVIVWLFLFFALYVW